MNNVLFEWLEKQFYYSNHRKYHKYFKEWISNITDSQIEYFERQRVNMITQAMIQH